MVCRYRRLASNWVKSKTDDVTSLRFSIIITIYLHYYLLHEDFTFLRVILLWNSKSNFHVRKCRGPHLATSSIQHWLLSILYPDIFGDFKHKLHAFNPFWPGLFLSFWAWGGHKVPPLQISKSINARMMELGTFLVCHWLNRLVLWRVNYDVSWRHNGATPPFWI